jgi:dephospho-CoA kinase
MLMVGLTGGIGSGKSTVAFVDDDQRRHLEA